MMKVVSNHIYLSNNDYFQSAIKLLLEKRGKVTALALSALGTGVLLFQAIRRIKENETFVFDEWKVRWGLTQRKSLLAPLDQDQLKNLAETRSPTELTRLLYACVRNFSQKEGAASQQIKPQWLEQMLAGTSERVEWGYQKNPGRSEEEEKAISVGHWMSTLQDWAILAGMETLSYSGSLFQAMQRSPRLAGSIVFGFIAPITAPMVWEVVKEVVPEFIKKIGDLYLANSGKFALAIMGGLFLLHRYAKHEKGILTNLSRQWEQLRGSHRGFDHVPSYGKSIEALLDRIGSTKKGERGSNILWYFHDDTHSTFKGAIGEVLAEMSATGRLYNSTRTSSNCPYLQDLQIWEIDLEHFLAEYGDTDEIHRGWRQIVNNIAKEKNVVVVIKGFSQIEGILIPRKQKMSQPSEGQGANGAPMIKEARSPECVLGRLVAQSIRLGHFRSIIEIDEERKNDFEKKGDLYAYFSPIRSFSLSTQELFPLFKRLFCSDDQIERIPETEMDEWLSRLEPILEKSPQPPQDLVDTVHDAIRRVEVQMRLNLNGSRVAEWEIKLKEVEKAEGDLREVLMMKGTLLQKKWNHMKEGRVSQQLNEAIALIEKVVLPIFAERLNDAKKQLAPGFSYRDELIKTVQSRFHQLFGPCTERELQKLQALPEILKREIIGQDVAIDSICQAVISWRQRPDLKGKPLVLFCAGPTGVGKSETATQLGYHLNAAFDVAEEYTKTDEHNVLRIQLGCKDHGGVFGWDVIRSKILGHILHNPISVVVLEEWDKMKEEDRNQLNELFEDTNLYLTESYNLYPSSEPVFVDRSSTIFMLTSNVSMDQLAKSTGDLETKREEIRKGIEMLFQGDQRSSGAFLSRMDALIAFHGVSSDDLLKIIACDLAAMRRCRYITEAQAEEALKTISESEAVQAKGVWDVRESKQLIRLALSSIDK